MSAAAEHQLDSKVVPRLPEIRPILAIGIGVGLSQFAQVAMGMTDAAMMARLGPGPLAAGMLVSSLWVQGALFCLGMQVAMLPVLGAAVGSGSSERVTSVLRAGQIMTAGLCVLQGLYLAALPFVLRLFTADATVIAEGTRYALGLIAGVIPWMFFVSTRFFLIAKGEVGIFVPVSLLGIVINALLNFVLMYGAVTGRPLGVVGSAISTSLTSWIMLGLLLAHMRLRANQRSVAEFFKGHGATVRNIVRDLANLGWPIGLIFFSENLIFSVGSLLIGRIDTTSLAAFVAVQQWLVVSYMLPVGISNAATARIGFHIGRGDNTGVRAVLAAALIITIVYSVALSVLFLALAPLCVRIFGVDPLAHPDFVAKATSDMAWLAVIQFFNNFIVVIAGVMRGFRDTKTPLIAMFRNYWIMGTGSTILLTFLLQERGVWLGIALGLALTLASITFSLRAKLSKLDSLIREIGGRDSAMGRFEAAETATQKGG
ncbi:MAG TPA: MATE family efflux transporter [Rhizomicrobium sp.]|nr:MATE family efflux transporter [Rhizomicrobium sp.]